MHLLRLLIPSALCVAALLGVPQQALADCQAPSDCICVRAETPTYALDVLVPADADLDAAVDVEVVAAFGDDVGSVLGDDATTFSLGDGSVLALNLIEPGERALLFLDATGRAIDARRLDGDGELDCYAVDPMPAADVVALAVRDDCLVAADADAGPCNDTGCSISGAGSSASLLLLALLGIIRRRR